jgi:hypothetical protein
MASKKPSSPARLAGALRSGNDRPARDSQPIEPPEPDEAALAEALLVHARNVAIAVEIAAAEPASVLVDGWECEATDAAGFAIDGWYVDGSPRRPDGSPPAASRSPSSSASSCFGEKSPPPPTLGAGCPVGAADDDVVAEHLRAAMGALCMERYARLAGWAALRPQVVGADPAAEDAARLCVAMAEMLDDLTKSSTTERAVERALAGRVGRWSS